MHRLSIVSSTNPRATYHSRTKIHSFLKRKVRPLATCLAVLIFACSVPSMILAQGEEEGEALEMSVVIVNPSTTKTQTVPIKMYLPQEVTPDSILSLDNLNLEYDSTKFMYYVYKDDVILKPSETKTFIVEIKDVWKRPQGRRES